MNFDRRTVIKAGGVASAFMVGGIQAVAATPGEASVAPLIAAGLDPFTVYRKIFASTENGAECYFLYCGALPFTVDEIGETMAFSEETFRAIKTENDGADMVRLLWREAGVFRDIQTGEIPKSMVPDPITGEDVKHNPTLGGGISQHIVSKSGTGLSITLVSANPGTQSTVSVNAEIKGDRVALSHIEMKSRAAPNGGPVSTTRAVLKAYASLAELKSKAPSVAAKGFYSVFTVTTGKMFVAGVMEKSLTMDAKINPIAWDRVKATNPAFFRDDRISPAWS
jgi:hypothetical protein